MNITIAAPLAAATLTALATMSKGNAPKLRVAIAGFVGAIMLNGLAMVAGPVARALAGLIILGALLGPGYDLAVALNRLINPPTSE